MKKIYLFIIIILVFVVALLVYNKIVSNQISKIGDANDYCLKEYNCCTLDSDCKYIDYTGGCYTPEYIAAINEKNKETGLINSIAPPLEDGKIISCACIENVCTIQ